MEKNKIEKKQEQHLTNTIFKNVPTTLAQWGERSRERTVRASNPGSDLTRHIICIQLNRMST